MTSAEPSTVPVTVATARDGRRSSIARPSLTAILHA